MILQNVNLMRRLPQSKRGSRHLARLLPRRLPRSASRLRRVRENLGDLWYAAQAAQSSARDMNAFGFAIEQSGGKAGEGAAELKTFTDYVKSTAGEGAFANWFKVPFDAAHPAKSLMVAIDQLSAERAKGGAAEATAIQRAKLMGINPDELNLDRVAKMHKAFDSKLKETGWIDDLSKKSAQLNADFSAVTTHLKEMAEQASGPLIGAMSGLLEKADAWLVKGLACPDRDNSGGRYCQGNQYFMEGICGYCERPEPAG